MQIRGMPEAITRSQNLEIESRKIKETRRQT